MVSKPFFLVATTVLAMHAHASDGVGPGGPVKLVVPYSAGGAADYVARVYADEVGKMLHRSIVVENRPGAGGTVAGAYVAREKADGNTLLLTSVSIHAINPNMAPANYSPNKDLAPIATIGNGYTALVVGKNSPFNTLPELISFAKAHPGKISYGSSGNGSITHLSAMYFLQAAGLKTLHVPYRGNPQVMTDLVGGVLDFTMDGVWLNSMKSGNVKVLAYAAPKRSPAMPQIPTVIEAGGLKYEPFAPWIGFAAPAGTPSVILDNFEKVILSVSQNPVVKQKLVDAGIEPESQGRIAMAAMIQRDFIRIGETIKSLNINSESNQSAKP